MTFESFNLHPRILSNAQAQGYKTPTPIQQKAIPTILNKQDVMGLAQTGTGKTAAFVLPILNRLMEGPRGQIRALIIAPTRELAQQIHEAICDLSHDTGLRSTPLYGGQNIFRQKQKLRRGVEIVVACPGRLLDHVGQQTIDLNKLEVLVLDEADQMFDMGFLPAIRKVLQHVPKKRQSLLFSATMPNELRKLATDILHQPVTIQVGSSAPTTNVSQALYPVSQHLKTELLIKILQTVDPKSILVFTRTKHKAKQVAEQLEEAGYRATSLQGNLSQNKRQSALNSFRDGSLQILVATDIASRGIDVAGISHVINYDIPETVEAYTHRIGRTGRANKLGDAFTLVTREDMSKVRAIERTTGVRLKNITIADFDYNARTPMRHDHAERRPRDHQPRQQKFERKTEGQPAKSHAGSPTKKKTSSGRFQFKSSSRPNRSQSSKGQSAR